MGWLRDHLENFVKPYLGFIPEVKASDECFFRPEEMTLLKNVWRSAKAIAKEKGLGMLLTGRDMWAFHVLACREGYAHVYRPEIGRSTKQYVREDYRKFFCLDSGFSGSIPRHFQCEAWMLLHNISANGFTVVHTCGRRLANASPFFKELAPIQNDLHQVFPRCRRVRDLCTLLEQHPKYWFSGIYVNPATMNARYFTPKELEAFHQAHYDSATGLAQHKVPQDAFAAAVRITIEVYRDSSPHFVKDFSGLEVPRTRPTWMQKNPFVP